MIRKDVSGRRRRFGAAGDFHPDNATNKTSSVGSIASSPALSPSFHRSLLNLQKQLPSRVNNKEDDELEYIRVLRSCLSGAAVDPSSPCSISTAGSDGEETAAEPQRRCYSDSSPYTTFQRRQRAGGRLYAERLHSSEGKQFFGVERKSRTEHVERRDVAEIDGHESATEVFRETPYDSDARAAYPVYYEGSETSVRHTPAGNTNVILLDDGNNAGVEVSLRKLRTGMQGQQRLIRLHRVGTHLQLEYSEAVEDLELSFVPTKAIATRHGDRYQNVEQVPTKRPSYAHRTSTCANDHLIATSPVGMTALCVVSGVLGAAIGAALYFRSRSSSMA
ncbi:hypothetical protein, conserved [Babesia bigemina]|uniref:Uncharacterized protein n=1 Tax=Babesia bigemina TaxID=5866 RepID=A0A061D465_BABBI|nr:hypothetical protein, conserved [Babesia bigemina]CDR95536.1 hypothetical protein, conserved [Babesia bigemina]|eukprot:XP_012767722.1 hypothetical protein, conserved [Babesia bigemina]